MNEIDRKHVFISYSRSNSDLVDKLSDSLKSYGIDIWLDKEKIQPGENWLNSIEQAIQQGAFFIACFSNEYLAGNDGVRFEELNLAIDQIRRKPDNHIWFIPILLNECTIPDMSIRKGRKLDSLHYLKLYKDWEEGIKNIISVICPDTISNQFKKFNPFAKYVGTCVDYFAGATGDTPLKLEIAANKDGKIVLFHNLDLIEKLKRIEYFTEEKRFTLLSEDMGSRYFGMPLDDGVAKNLVKGDKILMVRFNEDTGRAMQGMYLPLKIYE